MYILSSRVLMDGDYVFAMAIVTLVAFGNFTMFPLLEIPIEM